MAQLVPDPPRLWESDHPYYGAEGVHEHYDTFAELRAAVDQRDEDLTFVYRWDWFDPAAACNDELYTGEEERTGKQRLTLFVVLQRKSKIQNWSCEVTHADEPAVLEWLHSDRIAGHLRRTWAPILETTPAPMDLAHLRADLDYWRERALAAEVMVSRLEQRLTAPTIPSPGPTPDSADSADDAAREDSGLGGGDVSTRVEWRAESEYLEEEFGTDEAAARSWMAHVAVQPDWEPFVLMCRDVTFTATPWRPASPEAPTPTTP